MSREKSTTPFRDTDFWKSVQLKISKLGQLPLQEAPSEPNARTFERDILLNRFILGGPSIYDEASLLHPMLKQTEVIRWYTDVFKPSYWKFALILGDAGSGKTWGSLAYANSIAEVRWEMGKIVHANAQFITAYQLSELLVNQKRNQSELAALSRRGILVIDDLGTEPPGYRGKDFLAHFEQLINERHMFRRTTLMTSNLTKEGFREMYGKRVVSRFNQVGQCLETTDSDYRQGGT